MLIFRISAAIMISFFLACTHTKTNRAPASGHSPTLFVNESQISSGRTLIEGDYRSNDQEAPETEPEPWVRLAQSEIDPNARRSCAISALLISYLDETNEKELSRDTQIQIEELKKHYGKNPNKLQRKILRDLARIERHETGKDHFRKTFSALCKASRAVGGTIIRSGALSASAVTSALTLPIRFVSKAGIGVFTREESNNRGPGYADLLGGRGITNWTGPLYQTIRVAFFSGNPVILGVYGLTSIDLQIQTLCRSKTIKKSKREEKLCSNYEAIKRGEFAVTEVGEKIGVKIGKTLLHTLDFREDGVLDPRICEKSPKKQIRIAHRAKERLIDGMRKDGYSDFKAHLIPPEVGGCVQILAEFKTRSDRENFEIKNQEGFIDGVAIVTDSEEEIQSTNEIDPSKTTAVTPTPTPDLDRSDERLCAELYKSKGLRAIQKKEGGNPSLQLIQAALNPVRYASLNLMDLAVPSEKLRSEPSEYRGQGKNLVYILAPNAKQRKEYETISEKLKSLQDEIEKERKKLKKVVKEKNYESCLSRQEEVGFDWKKFEELSQSLREMSVAQRITEFETLLKEVKKAGRKLFVLNSRRMKWEIREFTSLNQFREAVSDYEVRNVVFVSHGEQTGKIIDSNMNLLPASAFSWISPSIQSISLFSCHTDQLIRTFKADEQLKGQESFFPVRYLGMVNSHEIFESKNQAPSVALSEFLEDLDRELFRAEVGNERAQTVFGSKWTSWEKPKICEFSSPGTSVKNGAFNLKLVSDGLKSYWLGILDTDTIAGSTLKAPCNWLGDKNEITIENANPKEKSSLQGADFKLLIKSQDGNEDSIEPLGVFKREDNSIRGVKWIYKPSTR